MISRVLSSPLVGAGMLARASKVVQHVDCFTQAGNKWPAFVDGDTAGSDEPGAQASDDWIA